MARKYQAKGLARPHDTSGGAPGPSSPTCPLALSPKRTAAATPRPKAATAPDSADEMTPTGRGTSTTLGWTPGGRTSAEGGAGSRGVQVEGEKEEDGGGGRPQGRGQNQKSSPSAHSDSESPTGRGCPSPMTRGSSDSRIPKAASTVAREGSPGHTSRLAGTALPPADEGATILSISALSRELNGPGGPSTKDLVDAR